MKLSIPIQNAFIKADYLGVIDWNSVSFDNDIKILNDIIINEDDTEIYINTNFIKNYGFFYQIQKIQNKKK